MVIQIDSREKERAIKKIVEEFDRQCIKHPISKLLVGDYMNYDNPRLIIDRKQNLSELCSNVCQDHERFRRELQRANENGIRVIFLIEHGNGIKQLTDVIWWENPRRWKRIKNSTTGRFENVETKATEGDTLYKILRTQEQKYGCEFLFCEKKDTGKRIIELLSGDANDKR
ncbi:MAG: ERCC4 domain-containing protein [Anaerovoracaceae bacterium]